MPVVENMEHSFNLPQNNATIKFNTNVTSKPKRNSHFSHTRSNPNAMLRDEIIGSKSARHSTTVSTASNKVIVAVKAEKVISNTALAWALTHIVHSSDSITLLAVYSTEKTGIILILFNSILF